MVLKLENVTFEYENKVIFKDLNITFEEGKIYSIIGPNGSGKSTLLKLLLCFVKVKEGKIEIEQKDLYLFSPIQRAKIFSYVPQIPQYDGDMTLFELVKKGDYPHMVLPPPPRPFKERLKIVEDYLELDGLWNRRLNTLSGGEIQRGLIARAIVQDTPILIMDEPFNHLDVSHRVIFLRLINKLKREKKIIIYTTHDLNCSSGPDNEIYLIKKDGVLVKLKKDENNYEKILKETFNVKFQKIKNERETYYIPIEKEV